MRNAVTLVWGSLRLTPNVHAVQSTAGSVEGGAQLRASTVEVGAQLRASTVKVGAQLRVGLS